MKLTDLILSMNEARPADLGHAYWISPQGEIIPVEGEHQDTIKKLIPKEKRMGVDPVYYAIRHRWSRITIQDDGDSVLLSVGSLNAAKRAFSIITEKGICKDDPQTLTVDIYGPDSYVPVVSRRFDPWEL